MLVQLFIAVCIFQRFVGCAPVQMSKLCDRFMNEMNQSDSSLRCKGDRDEWEFETSNMIVKFTINEEVNIECRQPADYMQNELNFFKFSTLPHHVLVLSKCPKIHGLNEKIEHLAVQSHIENFNLKPFSVLQQLELVNTTQFQNLNSLTRLEELSISRMYLSNLTINLNRLHTLTLRSNYIRNDLHGVHLTNLKKLLLRHNRNLKHENFENFPNLETLEINSEFAVNESYDINRIVLNTNLEVLEIRHFQFNEIWNENLLSGHKHLRRIHLNNNRIVQIQSNRIFNDLPNLEELDLSGNELSDIEFLVGSNLPRIRILKLSKNHITSLVESLYTLTSLEELHLNNNYIARIDDNFFTFAQTKLTAIYLQNNNLTFLSNSKNNPFETIAPSLVTLNLRSNRLTQFNEMYAFKFNHLTDLDVSHNAIDEVRGSDLQFRHKININFESNEIRVIRFNPNMNYSQVTLKFDRNLQFDRVNCENYEFIKYFAEHRERRFINFPTLDNINISNYYCVEKTYSTICAVDECVCKKFPYTSNYYIACRNKNLTKLPDALPTLPNFTVNLDLDNNNFSGLTNFGLPSIYYTNVARLSLRNCSINNFATFRLYDNRITELYLDDNRIANFSYSVVKNFTNLVNLTLANNRFECNCDTEYIYKFLTLKSYYHLDLLICANRNMTDFIINQHFIVCPLINSAVFATLIVTLLLVIVVATVTIVKLKFALELKLLIFVFKSRYFNTTGATTTNYAYDLFLSYSDDDTEFVEKNILSKLESQTKSPRNHIVTINRDYTMDKMIPEQIVHFVNNSKFVVIVLSTNFLNSDWNRFTFRAAYCNAFQNNRYPAIIILKDNIKDLSSIDPTLKSYLVTRTYIRYDSPLFWKRINYILSK